MTEKEQVTLLSKKIVKHLCKCWTKKTPPTLVTHTEKVFSDGSIRFECSNCGQVKFTIIVGGR